MKVIFAGTPSLAIPTAESLIAHGHEIVCVVTRPDALLGRKRVLTPSPVAIWAGERGIPAIKATRVTQEIDYQIRQAGAQVGVVVAYGALLPLATLEALEHGWFNLHFSELPRYRGAAPVQRALMAGEKSVTTCVFKLVGQMDAGAVASRRAFSVEPNETAASLLERLSVAAADQASEVLSNITSGQLTLIEQSGEPTFAPKIDIDEARFVPSDSATINFNRYRGVTVEPGFWFVDGDQRIKVLVADVSTTATAPASLELHADGVHLGCASGSLVLVTVQPAGKAPMSALDWMRGRRS